MRNYYLGMAFCTQCATFKEGLLEPNTLSIHVLPCFHVVYCIHHKSQVSPEVIVEDRLILLAHPQLYRFKVDCTVYTLPH